MENKVIFVEQVSIIISSDGGAQKGQTFKTSIDDLVKI